MRTVVLLFMIVGLSYNWNIINDGVKKIQNALRPDDINFIPDWVNNAFTKFCTQYGKSYNPIDMVHRMKVFFSNL